MHGIQLHDFDMQLCRHALDNVRAKLSNSDFAAYVKEQLPAPVMAYLHALGEDEEPPPLLLNDQELDDLSTIFAGGPFQLDRHWTPYSPLYRRGLDCAPEIREALTREHAEQWAKASARFAEQLEGDCVYLGTGIKIVREWVGTARRLLRAMGRVDLLPAPEGSFPTPTSARSPGPTGPADRSDEPPASLAGCVQRIRELFQGKPSCREDKPDTVRRQANLNKQKVLQALRWLEKRGEYRGHARSVPQRYLDERPSER